MVVKKILSGLLISLGLVVAIAAVWLCFSNLNGEPVLLSEPEEAQIHTQKFMDAIVSGDYREAGTMMYGTPDLGAERLPETPVGGQLWYTFQNTLSYAFAGDCYASGTGIARDVTIQSMDLDAVLDKLAQRAPDAVSEKTHNTNDFSQIYDENNNYREAFVMEVLQDTLMEILNEDISYVSNTVTLNLIYQDEQWWVLPDQELIRVISGGIAG